MAKQSKIGFFELDGWEGDTIKSRLSNADIVLGTDKLNENSLPKQNDLEIISVFVGSEITSKVINHFPELKFVATRSTGFDHIDLKACQEKGVQVAYVPGYGDNTVAEFAFALILNLTRRVYRAIDRIKETGEFAFHDLRGIDIKGKTLGVVGTGRIGREVIKIAKGFGMNVIAHDPYPNEKFAKEMEYRYMTLEKLLGEADIVTLHVPYMPATHHLINQNNIKLMKKGAYLINTARGGLVETNALVSALRDGNLGGVGLDVLEEEGEIKDELEYLRESHPKAEELRTMLQNHILMNMPNVLITPHNSFNSEEALQRILDTTLGNIESFLAGKPQNLVPESHDSK